MTIEPVWSVEVRRFRNIRNPSCSIGEVFNQNNDKTNILQRYRQVAEKTNTAFTFKGSKSYLESIVKI